MVKLDVKHMLLCSPRDQMDSHWRYSRRCELQNAQFHYFLLASVPHNATAKTTPVITTAHRSAPHKKAGSALHYSGGSIAPRLASPTDVGWRCPKFYTLAGFQASPHSVEMSI